MSRAARALTALLASLLLRPVTALLIGATLPSITESAVSYAFAAAAQEVLLFLLPSLLLRPWRCERLNPPRRQWTAWLLAPVAGLAAQLAVLPLSAWWVQWTGAAPLTLPQPAGTAEWALYALALALLPAVAEELFFRGALMSALLAESSGTVAVTLTTLLFALSHGSLSGLPAHLLISLTLTMCMRRYGRLLPCVLLHAAYNLAALFCPMPPTVWGLVCAAALAGLLAAALLTVPVLEKRRLSRGTKLLALAGLLVAALQYL